MHQLTDMDNLSDILSKIRDSIVFIAYFVFRGIFFLLRHLCRFIYLAFRFGIGIVSEPRSEADVNEIKSGKNPPINLREPEISDDNSEVEEASATIAIKLEPPKQEGKISSGRKNKQNEQNPAKQKNNSLPVQKMKGKSPETSVPPSVETELRQRSGRPKSRHPNCQVCGNEPPTMHCVEPRCYIFFCNDCDALYHKHPRRQNHIRKDISTYTPNAHAKMGLPSTPTGKVQQVVSARNSVQTGSPGGANLDIASAAQASSIGETWVCDSYTFLNTSNEKICRMGENHSTYSMPSTQVVKKENEKQHIEEEIPKIPPKGTMPLINLKDITADANNKLYTQYWDKANQKKMSRDISSPSPSQSNISFSDISGTVQHGRSPRGHGSGAYPKNTPNKQRGNLPKVTKAQEELNTDRFQQIDQPIVTENNLSTWECEFCTLYNDSSVNICAACCKSNPKKLNQQKREDTNPKSTNEGPSKNVTSSQVVEPLSRRQDAAGTTNVDDEAASANIDVVAMKFMQDHHIDNYDVAKMASKLVDKNFRKQDAIEAAKSCRTMDEALAYLQQECLLCQKTHNTREMIQMVFCTHRFCNLCTSKYFATQIRTNNITSFVCPTCNTPRRQQIENFNDDMSDYFANLGKILKPILGDDEYEMYQTKLMDWFLMKNPDYVQCPNCPYGGVLGDKRWNRMECAQCHVTTCLRCKKQWRPAHEGRSCEEFAQWEENQDREFPTNSKTKVDDKKGKKGQSKNTKINEPENKTFLQKTKTFFLGSPDDSAHPRSGPQRGYSIAANDNRSQLSINGNASQINYPSDYPPLGNLQLQHSVSTYTQDFRNPGSNTPRTKSPHVQNVRDNTRSQNQNSSPRTAANSSEHTSSVNTAQRNVDDFRLERANIRGESAQNLGALLVDASIPIGGQNNNAMDWESSNENYSGLIQEQRRKELERKWKLIQLAQQKHFSAEELEIALLHDEEEPIRWLQNSWHTSISYVKIVSNNELRKLRVDENNPITETHARIALGKHMGNCNEAVKACVEEVLRQLAESQSGGQLYPDMGRAPSEPTYSNNAQVGASASERIYSHTDLTSGCSIMPASTVRTMLARQEFMNGVTTSLVPPTSTLLPQNLATQQSIETHLQRVDTAVEQARNRLQNSLDPATQAYLAGRDRNLRNPEDGPHAASPASSGYDQEYV